MIDELKTPRFFSRALYMTLTRALLIGLALAAAYWLYKNKKIPLVEGMAAEQPLDGFVEQELATFSEGKKVLNERVQALGDEEALAKLRSADELVAQNKDVLPHPQMSNMTAPQGSYQAVSQQAQLDCFPGDQLNAADLMPSADSANAWADSNPQVQGAIDGSNYLTAGHHYGINTQGNSLGISPNLQLRSDPYIPQKDVGPWHQSTAEPDNNRLQFEIGSFEEQA